MNGLDDPITVLYVDDSGIVEELAAQIGEQAEPLRVDVADDGESALNALVEEDYDCVVSDYEMEEMDGLELLDQVRDRWEDIPFILYTGRGSEEAASEAITAGVTDYVLKQGGQHQIAVLANRIKETVARRRAEERVESVADWYQTLLENTTEIVTVLNEDGVIQYAAPSVEDVFNVSQSRLEGVDMFSRVHPSDEQRLRDVFEATVNDSDGKETVTARFVDGSNRYRWVETTFRNMTDDPGVGGIIANNREVTDDRRRLRRLERYETVIEAVDDAVWVIGLDGRIEYVNDSVVDWLDTTRGEASGLRFEEFGDDFAVGDEFDECSSLINDVLVGAAECGQFEVEFDLPDGNIVADARLSRIDVDGEPAGAVVIARDITDRVRRLEELEQYQTITETVPVGVFVIDDAGRFVGGNHRTAHLVGLDYHDIVGEPLEELVDEGLLERYREAVDDLTAGGEVEFQYEAVVDGEQRIFQIRVVPRPPSGDEFQGVIGAISDVTERRRRKQELERQNERLERFASVVSHDLRNPLNIANGNIDLYLQEEDNPHVEKAAKALDRMREMVDDLLTLAREGETVDAPVEVDFEGLARAAWQTAQTAEASIEVESTPNLYADPGRLRQVFENLFRNSVDHGPDDVTVRVGALDGESGFYVEDTGPGIPETDRSRVFERGYTSHDAGTGFGLAIVREIADAHGWNVTVDESVEGGARFEFRP